jgi:hypothetical protein
MVPVYALESVRQMLLLMFIPPSFCFTACHLFFSMVS